MRKKNIILFTAFVILMAAPVSLSASGDGAHHFDWAGFLGKLLNSSLLIAAIVYFLRKPLIEMLSKKSVDIRTDIKVREKELKDQKKSLTGIQARLDRIEDEVSGMMDEAKKSGEMEAERIRELAKLEAERILKNSREEIDTRIESSVLELKKKIADMTIEEFRNNYRSILNMDLHKKIIDRNIEISGDIIEKG